MACDPLEQFDDSIEFQSNFNLQVSLVNSSRDFKAKTVTSRENTSLVKWSVALWGSSDIFDVATTSD